MSKRNHDGQKKIEDLAFKIPNKEMIVTRGKAVKMRRQLRIKSSPKLLEKQSQNSPISPTKSSLRTTRVTEKLNQQKERPRATNKVTLRPPQLLRKVEPEQKNKRKLTSPQKTSNHSSLKNGPKDKTVKVENKNVPEPPHKSLKQRCLEDERSLRCSFGDVIRLRERTEELTDEDLLEIVQCPSPVWWEDPPDERCDEEPVFIQTSPFKRKASQEKKPEKTEEAINMPQLPESKCEPKFLNKRTVLENVLQSLKSKSQGNDSSTPPANLSLGRKVQNPGNSSISAPNTNNRSKIKNADTCASGRLDKVDDLKNKQNTSDYPVKQTSDLISKTVEPGTRNKPKTFQLNIVDADMDNILKKMRAHLPNIHSVTAQMLKHIPNELCSQTKQIYSGNDSAELIPNKCALIIDLSDDDVEKTEEVVTINDDSPVHSISSSPIKESDRITKDVVKDIESLKIPIAFENQECIVIEEEDPLATDFLGEAESSEAQNNISQSVLNYESSSAEGLSNSTQPEDHNYQVIEGTSPTHTSETKRDEENSKRPREKHCPETQIQDEILIVETLDEEYLNVEENTGHVINPVRQVKGSNFNEKKFEKKEESKSESCEEKVGTEMQNLQYVHEGSLNLEKEIITYENNLEQKMCYDSQGEEDLSVEVLDEELLNSDVQNDDTTSEPFRKETETYDNEIGTGNFNDLAMGFLKHRTDLSKEKAITYSDEAKNSLQATELEALCSTEIKQECMVTKERGVKRKCDCYIENPKRKFIGKDIIEKKFDTNNCNKDEIDDCSNICKCDSYRIKKFANISQKDASDEPKNVIDSGVNQISEKSVNVPEKSKNLTSNSPATLKQVKSVSKIRLVYQELIAKIKSKIKNKRDAEKSSPEKSDKKNFCVNISHEIATERSEPKTPEPKQTVQVLSDKSPVTYEIVTSENEILESLKLAKNTTALRQSESDDEINMSEEESYENKISRITLTKEMIDNIIGIQNTDDLTKPETLEQMVLHGVSPDIEQIVLHGVNADMGSKTDIVIAQKENLKYCFKCSSIYDTVQCSYCIQPQKHLVKKPVSKSYSCDLCEYTSKKRCYMEVHAMRHTNDKPYGCDHCKNTFKTKATLRSHLQRYCGKGQTETDSKTADPCQSYNVEQMDKEIVDENSSYVVLAES